MSEIKNVVFDVGDVLVDFCYRKMMKNLGFDEDAVDYLSDNMVLTEFWHELDLGIMTEAEALEKFTREIPQYKEEIIKFWDNTEYLVEEYSYSEDLIRRIKDNGFGVYILSNYPIETAEVHWPKFKFLPITDGHIISGYEKITKPDPAIYKLLESRFGIDLTECLFIDDREVNVKGAEAVGMQAVLFTGYEKLISDLVGFHIL